eukprot:TRINITY_DN366_c0_g1_i1.p1 TRINITY_DN366_c0_g1~~TRINITY_DN366_c0_g1_i1.p1  ORF type:complete len:412 (+),score=123.70 TRINITY_DN366_c0_g1_i1:59-1237(+)
MRAVVAALAAAAGGAAGFPESMLGVWQGTPSTTPVGPWNVPYNYTIGRDTKGGYYLEDAMPEIIFPASWQRFHLIGDKYTYCGHLLSYGFPRKYPANVVQAFQLEKTASTDSKVVFCNSMMSRAHFKANCTGCGCIQLTIELTDNDTMTHEVLLSAPAVHYRATLTRVAQTPPTVPAPAVDEHGFAKCNFSLPMPPSAATRPCPMMRQAVAPAPADSRKPPTNDRGCVQLNVKMGMRMAWKRVGSDMQITVSAPTTEAQYVALGFKETFGTPVPTYYGMENAPILMAYRTESGGCVRKMVSKEYVGVPTDDDSQLPFLTSTEVERSFGWTKMTFSMPADKVAGLPGRVMFAIGGAPATCSAAPSYHMATRGFSVSPLYANASFEIIPSDRWC